MKNLHAAHYISSELAGLEGEELWEKQADGRWMTAQLGTPR
jgi:hypothetical protein